MVFIYIQLFTEKMKRTLRLFPLLPPEGKGNMLDPEAVDREGGVANAVAEPDFRNRRGVADGEKDDDGMHAPRSETARSKLENGGPGAVSQ